MRYTEEELVELFEKLYDEYNDLLYEIRKKEPAVDGVYLGLTLVKKITQTLNCIEGADHDKIYSANVSRLVEHEIEEEDLKDLIKWGWHIEDDGLVHFV